MNIIQTGRIRATVLARRAPARWGALDRGIAHEVPVSGAGGPLEDMEETEPMSDLMGGGTTQVERCSGSAGDGLLQDIASVLLVGGATGGGVGWEVADAEEAAAEVGEEVHVEVFVGAFAESGLHRGVVVARGPLIIDREVSADEGKANAGGTVATVEDG